VFSQTVHAVAATVGFASWFLLWCALVLGLAVRNGWAGTRVRHSTLQAAHGALALLGLALGIVHGGAQLAVPNGIVRLVDEVVPFVNPSDPVGVGAGALSLELLLAAAVSVPVRKRLGHARWRAVHTLSYGAFVLVTAHVLISGSDAGPTWVWLGVLTGCAAVLVLWVASTRLAARAGARLLSRVVDRGRTQTLAVDVDAGRCQRFGFCEHEAPDVFRLQGNGRLAYRAHVPTDGVERVIRAAEVCPARAIALRRLATTVLTADTGPVPRVPAGAGLPTATSTAVGGSAGTSAGGAADASASDALRTDGLPIFPAAGDRAGRYGPFPVARATGTTGTTHRRGRTR
jgi:sulfoxide reductase heme-binding subunit YedZ